MCVSTGGGGQKWIHKCEPSVVVRARIFFLPVLVQHNPVSKAEPTVLLGAHEEPRDRPTDMSLILSGCTCLNAGQGNLNESLPDVTSGSLHLCALSPLSKI